MSIPYEDINLITLNLDLKIKGNETEDVKANGDAIEYIKYISKNVKPECAKYIFKYPGSNKKIPKIVPEDMIS